MIEAGVAAAMAAVARVASDATEAGAVETAEQAATRSANGTMRERRTVLSDVEEFKMDSKSMREAAILESYKARTVPARGHRLNPLWSRELRDYSREPVGWCSCPCRGQRV
jgi:hypothetical protein